MSGSRADPPEANPITVEVTRGPIIESRHRGSAAVLDGAGTVVAAWGEIDRPIYPRSAVKPLQAIPLLETGAAEAFGLGEREIALACASHNGETAHVETVRAWLQRIGLGEADLECGSHWPSYEAAARALAAAGEQPGAAHNNCSGKHAGFLSIARHLGLPTRGYVCFEHPIQQMIRETLEAFCEVDLKETWGIDGCGIPTYAIPLRHLALGLARMAAPESLPAARGAAVLRILRAVAAEPFMLAGSERYCTRIMQLAGGGILVKVGAEGVFCAALPQAGLGIALKCDDGAGRAAEVMMSALLVRFAGLTGTAAEQLRETLRVIICNRSGAAVGEIQPAPALQAPA